LIIDFHVHTSDSPGGKFTPAQLLEKAAAAGLDGICITDFHQISPGALEGKELGRKAGLVVLAGFEAVTELGHFLVFVPHPEKLPPVSAWLRLGAEGRLMFASLLEAVRSQQGILVAAHPFDRQRSVYLGDRLARLEGLTAIEALNGRSGLQANEMAEELAASLGLPGLGGSDTLDDLEKLGRVATITSGPVTNESDLIRFVSEGCIWPLELGRPLFRPTSTKPQEHKRPAHRRTSQARAGGRPARRRRSR
jgi:predicted metal-dependent phosphoesterase TrpH